MRIKRLVLLCFSIISRHFSDEPASTWKIYISARNIEEKAMVKLSCKNWLPFMRFEGFYKKCATSYCNLRKSFLFASDLDKTGLN